MDANPSALRRWLQPTPDSYVTSCVQAGRPAWLGFAPVAWSLWVFVMPALYGSRYSPEFGYTLRWLLLTLGSYPLFLVLFFIALLGPKRRAMVMASVMIALCVVLLRWYPSGLVYFMFGCMVVHPRRDLWRYLGVVALLNLALIGYASFVGYSWQAVIWVPIVTLANGVALSFDYRLRESNKAFLLSQEEVRRLAGLAERERIGRDLHDLLGHTLSLVILKSDLAARLMRRDPEAALAEITEVGKVGREALVQVRGAVSGIRATGIAAELASARVLLEADGVALEYRVGAGLEAVGLRPDVEHALAMLVREAATNIQRHARAGKAVIRFDVKDGEAVLSVEDNGHGGTIVPGHGLTGMRERIEAMQGSLSIERAAAGTRLQARVPMVIAAMQAEGR
jgi:two-component system sensor histidine kinase DesK